MSSASAIVAPTWRGHHLLKIDGYSFTKDVPTGQKIESRPFDLGGHRWHIDYYPNGCTAEDADYISLFLVLEDSVFKAVKAQQKFSFAGEVKGQAPSLGSSVTVNNYTCLQGWGTGSFVKREDLEESEHLHDDSFTVRCDIVVISDYQAEDLPESTPPFVSVAPSDLHQHLGDLLRNEKGADVVFEVAGETFAAHRCVLAARSPVFSAMLFGGMKEGNTVHIHDMDAQVFKALLGFAYTDSLAGATEEDEEDEAMFQHLLACCRGQLHYNFNQVQKKIEMALLSRCCCCCCPPQLLMALPPSVRVAELPLSVFFDSDLSYITTACHTGMPANSAKGAKAREVLGQVRARGFLDMRRPITSLVVLSSSGAAAGVH